MQNCTVEPVGSHLQRRSCGWHFLSVLTRCTFLFSPFCHCFAQVVPCDQVGKFLIRGCSARPVGSDTLCQQHAAARDASLPPQYAEIAAHRLLRALHSPDDVQWRSRCKTTGVAALLHCAPGATHAVFWAQGSRTHHAASSSGADA